jgi:hypothetical protein
MTTLIVTFVVLAVIFALMSVGVLMGGKPVQGSCGGLNKVGGLGDCDICGGDRNKCEETSSK